MTDNKSEGTQSIEESTFSSDTAEKILNELDGDSESDKDSKKENPFNDFIDEEALKETEAILNEEEKEKRKEESDSLKQKGNEEFKNENFMESVNIYTTALRICPLSYTNDRSILYSNRSASKIKLDYKESALEDCTKALELNPEYAKALLRRAKLHENMNKLDESLNDYKKLLTLDESNSEVKHAIYVLNAKIEKRNEEMKEEMLGKLKDLGNLILKPFGLSTENFQMNKDPNSGGYSINFNKNQ
ncbi:uncharacterized protein CBL_00473 [Carabus blaptoides fortunei]